MANEVIDTLTQLMAADPQHQQTIQQYKAAHFTAFSKINVAEEIARIMDETIELGHHDLTLKYRLKELFEQLQDANNFIVDTNVLQTPQKVDVYPYLGDIVDYEECLQYFIAYIEKDWLQNRANKLPTYFQAGTQSAKTGYTLAEAKRAFDVGTDVVVLITKNDVGAAHQMTQRCKGYKYFKGKVSVSGKDEVTTAHIMDHMLLVGIQNQISIDNIYKKIEEYNKHSNQVHGRNVVVHVIIDEVDECNSRNATDVDNKVNAIRSEFAIKRIIDNFDATYSGYTATMLQEAILYSYIDDSTPANVDLIPSQVHYLPCHKNYKSFMPWNVFDDGTVSPSANVSFFEHIDKFSHSVGIHDFDIKDNIEFALVCAKWQLSIYNKGKQDCPDIVTVVRDVKRSAHLEFSNELKMMYLVEGYQSEILTDGLSHKIPKGTQVVIIPYNGNQKNPKSNDGYPELLCSKLIKHCYQEISRDELVAIIFVGDNMQNRTITFEAANEDMYYETDFYYGAFCNLTILGTKSKSTNIPRLAQELRNTGIRTNIKEHQCLTTEDISRAITSYTLQQMAFHNAIKTGTQNYIELGSNRPIAKGRLEKVYLKAKATSDGKMTVQPHVTYADRMSNTMYKQHDMFISVPRGASGEWLDVEWAIVANSQKLIKDKKRVFCAQIETFVNATLSVDDAINTTENQWRPVSNAYHMTMDYFDGGSKKNGKIGSDSKWNIAGQLGWNTPTTDCLAKLFPSGDGALFFFTDTNGDRWLYLKKPNILIEDGSDLVVYNSASDNFLVKGVLPPPSKWESKFVHKYESGTQLTRYYR